ncbi:tetratricopeptide (TPR) repeat protein [Haloferula luteola]|uniref:Tetratricopeptide (TPR) repeat protein n=1 Tax=Haloferula luteola TaxID=595692 RepID=A0A840VBL6_9BACT|nr:tetratricopeptide repeat protein [Haloferula luteola]MBB5351199.1 tetratricopeptide (TPR) repeat protein [Haloferula luteola]
MRRLLALALLAPFPGLAQDAPRAVPVDPSLVQDPAQDWFQHGRNVYESAKRASGQTQLDLYSRAAEIFSQYLTNFPGHENAEAAWWYLGQSCYSTGRIDEAKRAFHTLLNRFGKGRYAAAAAYTLAADHFNNRQYGLAATLFEKQAAIATQPSDRLRGHYYAAKSYELLGQSRPALQHFKTVLNDADPSNVYRTKAALDYGRLIAAGGDHAEALQLFEQVVNSKTESAETRGKAALAAGATAAKLGRFDDSERYFQLILRTPGMEAERVEAQIAMMAAQFEQKNYREVIKIFQSSTLTGEGEVESRRLMLAARAFMMLDRNADAMPLFRQVERLEPPTSDRAFDAAYYRLLCFYRIEGRHVLDQVDAFLQLYGEKFSKDPKLQTARLMKAETLFAEGKVEDAANAYREIESSLLSEKNRVGLEYQRGRCLFEANDYAAAIRSLSSFIQANPSDSRTATALATRGRAYLETGENAKALADFNAVIAASEDRSLLTLAYLDAAEICKRDGNLKQMVDYFQRFLEAELTTDPDAIAKACYWTGWGLVKTSAGAKAIDYLTRAREVAPKRYNKHAGLLLCLVYLSEKNREKLIPEVGLAIEGGYAIDLPEPLIRWAADQAFSSEDFLNAARFYDLIADGENPELAPKEVWRFLGKARLRSGDAAGALTAIDHALQTEEDPAWKADGLADRASALLKLGKSKEATQAVEEGLALRPEGRTGAQLNLVRGDIFLAENQAQEAVRAYILPVELMDDSDQVVKPLAYHKLILALKAAGNTADATQYATELKRKYPNWSPPQD